ncbi:hypothetical protein ALP75_203997 [Pseudomonas syringae pv. actinidiae]|nr:hypothetical protein ALP75_203997 [Pseudomonas syringae pv. actinidiae]
MIVVVTAHDVEDHSTIELDSISPGELKPAQNLKPLFIAKRAGLRKVCVGQCTQRLDMEFLALVCPVKSSSAKMSPFIFLNQSALGHINTGQLHKLRIGVLDPAEP